MRHSSFAIAASVVLLAGLYGITLGAEKPATRPTPPGVVIDHIPASTGTYIGSPSIAVLPDGTYLASHDLFGPKSNEHVEATSLIFRSADRGLTWTRCAEIHGAFWSTLFVHHNEVYLIGTTAHHGDAVIRRSRDGGKTWTTPKDGKSGLLKRGPFHCAPVPVVEHAGRLWRAFEDADGGKEWGKRYRAMAFSVPTDADLLDAANWTFSSLVSRDESWLGGRFNAWLEGNAVVAPDGGMVDVLRVDLKPEGQTAAIVRISDNGKNARFDPASGFVTFPGGAVKFTIRWDPVSKKYWSLTNDIPPGYVGTSAPSVRNTLALTTSSDLLHWEVKSYLLHHPDLSKHGFQYVDWLFDGEDLIVACRTAFEDAEGGAHNFHDANYLTFHRISRFREMSMKDGVQIPEAAKAEIQSGDLQILGTGFTEGRLINGDRAFSNRQYIWQNVPATLAGMRVTMLAGGERARMQVLANRSITLRIAIGAAKKPLAPEGWQETEQTFQYTDTGRTSFWVFTRPAKPGEAIVIPQTGWAGTMVLTGN